MYTKLPPLPANLHQAAQNQAAQDADKIYKDLHKELGDYYVLPSIYQVISNELTKLKQGYRSAAKWKSSDWAEAHTLIESTKANPPSVLEEAAKKLDKSYSQSAMDAPYLHWCLCSMLVQMGKPPLLIIRKQAEYVKKWLLVQAIQLDPHNLTLWHTGPSGGLGAFCDTPDPQFARIKAFAIAKARAFGNLYVLGFNPKDNEQDWKPYAEAIKDNVKWLSHCWMMANSELLKVPEGTRDSVKRRKELEGQKDRSWSALCGHLLDRADLTRLSVPPMRNKGFTWIKDFVSANLNVLISLSLFHAYDASQFTQDIPVFEWRDRELGAQDPAPTAVCVKLNERVLDTVNNFPGVNDIITEWKVFWEQTVRDCQAFGSHSGYQRAQAELGDGGPENAGVDGKISGFQNALPSDADKELCKKEMTKVNQRLNDLYKNSLAMKAKVDQDDWNPFVEWDKTNLSLVATPAKNQSQGGTNSLLSSGGDRVANQAGIMGGGEKLVMQIGFSQTTNLPSGKGGTSPDQEEGTLGKRSPFASGLGDSSLTIPLASVGRGGVMKKCHFDILRPLFTVEGMPEAEATALSEKVSLDVIKGRPISALQLPRIAEAVLNWAKSNPDLLTLPPLDEFLLDRDGNALVEENSAEASQQASLQKGAGSDSKSSPTTQEIINAKPGPRVGQSEAIAAEEGFSHADGINADGNEVAPSKKKSSSQKKQRDYSTRRSSGGGSQSRVASQLNSQDKGNLAEDGALKPPEGVPEGQQEIKEKEGLLEGDGGDLAGKDRELPVTDELEKKGTGEDGTNP